MANLSYTLMGEDVEARRKFIEENALDVKILDIQAPVSASKM